MSNDPTVTICGNVTGDPALSFTASGQAWVRFTIAHTPRRRDPNTGQWVDGEAMFLRCTAWRDLAEHIAESVMRGTRVIATGRLRQSNWNDRTTGEKRSAIELVVDEIGPSLRFATATVKKAERTTSTTAGAAPAGDDPWATAHHATTGFATPSTEQDSQPPF